MQSRSASVLGRFALIALFGVALAAACTGVSTIGSGDAPLGKAGGASMSGGSASSAGGDTVSAGGKATSAPGGAGAGAYVSGGVSTGGDGQELGGAGAAGNAGMGGAAPLGPCTSDLDCPLLDVPCQTCADGSYACQKNHCDSGQCVRSADTCPAQCQTERDCPSLGLACTDCGDDTRACPSTVCENGKCQTSFPGCSSKNPCDGLVCGTQCKQCSGSGCSPGVLTYCGADGQCEPGLPQCGTGLICRTAADCGDPPPNCVACGTNSCAAYECGIDGFCVFKCPLNPHPECQKNTDCPISNRVCQVCPLGGCAVEACVNGVCDRVCPP